MEPYDAMPPSDVLQADMLQTDMVQKGMRQTGMPQTSGNPDSLFAQVAEKIAMAIVSGVVQPGDLIPHEGVLGTGLPVSRSVFREAVKYLSAKGLVESRQKSGTRAAPVSNWNLLDPDVLRWSLSAGAHEQFINDLYELRRFIEPNVARLAALRRTDAQAADLRRAVEGMAATAPASPDNIRHDLDFHETLLDSCGNQALMCLKGVVMTTLLWALRIQHGKTVQDYVAALADHKRVSDAVERRDGDMAAAVMTVLVNDAHQETLAMFRSRRAQKGRAGDPPTSAGGGKTASPAGTGPPDAGQRIADVAAE